MWLLVWGTPHIAEFRIAAVLGASLYFAVDRRRGAGGVRRRIAVVDRHRLAVKDSARLAVVDCHRSVSRTRPSDATGGVE